MPHTPTTLDCAWLLSDPGTTRPQAHARITLDGDRVSAVTALAQPLPGPRQLVLPALANAHDHGRTFRSATLGSQDLPLEGWLPYQGLVPGADPYLCAATSFARSVRRGVAHLMVHYTRVQGGMPFLEEGLAVARAARDVGVRIGFAVALRDQRGLGLCDDATMLGALRPDIREDIARRLAVRGQSPAQQVALVDELAASIQQNADLARHMTVQYGPTGVQWCSQPLLEAVAQGSADHQRPVHMHLLETPYQRQWADHAYPQGIVRYLDQIGLLSPRLTLAHCVHARSDELALLAERGVTIAVNTSSNLALKSGIAPLAEMLRHGCHVAMGLDGAGPDEDDDALREMRLAYALHRGWGFEEDMTRAQLWAFAARHGRHSVSGTSAVLGGSIAPGAPADLVVLHWDALDDDALFDNIDPLDLLLARGNGSHIDQVYVDGRCVVRGGKLATLDEAALRAELLAQVRSRIAAQADLAPWRTTVEAFVEDLGPFYRRSAWAGCC